MSISAPTKHESVGGVAVELRELSVRAGGRELLEKASARFEAGKVTLIVGPSGVGKSVLLRILAGLVGRHDESIRTSGKVEFDGGGRSNVGVVFQHFALFDELSPADNVRFARAHRSRSAPPGESSGPRDLLEELNVPQGVATGLLSGGQRQRLAIARTLAQNPDVILYDEPTSGLDVATGEQVAALIAETHESHPTTSIIVTHDYESLASIADRIYLFDWQSRSLREIARERWNDLRELLEPVPVDPPPKPRPWWLKPVDWCGDALRGAANFLASTARADEEILWAPLRLLPLWKSPLWGLRYFLHYLRLVAGPSAWLYIAIAGLIAGFVSTYFTFKFLPYEHYIKPLVIEDLLTSIGFALYRILVPLLAMILIAARCGAAVASDVGGKSYGRQLDAMQTFGARPPRYLLTGILYAFLIGAPLLTAVGYALAAVTSLVAFAFTHPDHGPEFWQQHFHSGLIVAGETFYRGSGWLLGKTLLCALGIGLVAYHHGAAAKQSPRDVSRGITSTILWSTLLVLVVHFVFAFFEFE